MLFSPDNFIQYMTGALDMMMNEARFYMSTQVQSLTRLKSSSHTPGNKVIRVYSVFRFQTLSATFSGFF